MTEHLFTSLNDVVAAGERMSFEAAAMETVIAKRLTRRQSNGINNALVYCGCESLYSVANEGIIDWVREKLSTVGRKINIAINKVYAFITRADEQTKELIRQAETDDTVELPISGKTSAAIIAAAAATVATIVYFTRKGSDEPAEKGKGMIAGLKTKFAEIRDNRLAMANKRAEIRKAKAHQTTHADQLKNDRHGPMNKWHLNEAKEGRARVKTHTEELRGLQAKTFLGKLRGCFSNIGKAVRDFVNSFRSAEKQAENAAKVDGSKSGVWKRIKGLGRSVKGVFTAVWGFFRAIPGKFKGKDSK